MQNSNGWIVILLLLFVLTINVKTSTTVVYAQSKQGSLSVRDISNLELEKNKNRSIDLPIYTKENLTSFSLIQRPSHGIINPIQDKNNRHSLSVNYVPSKNYTGPDGFFYKVAANSITSNVGKVSLVINPSNGKLVFVATPGQRAGLAFGISVTIVLLIFLIVYFIIKGLRMRHQTKIKPKFWDIIRDDNWYPSLAIFQFLLWTGIVLFAYFGVALTRVFSGVGVPTEIPFTIIVVMGISAAVPVVGSVVSDFKYAGTTPTGVLPTKELPYNEIRKRLPRFKTMLMENDKLTLTRFQMFAWTWIGIIAYLGLLYLEISKLGSFESLILPALPILFVSLMGLSQVTYLTAKSVRPSFFSINEVRPGRIRLQDVNKGLNNLTILGSNFGNIGTAWVEYYPPVFKWERDKYFVGASGNNNRMKKEDSDSSEKDWAEEFRYYRNRREEQYDVTPKTQDWADNRILVTLDGIKDKLKHQNYVVRVEKDGLLTYANSDAVFKLFPMVVQLNPDDGIINVPINSSISAIFDEPINDSIDKPIHVSSFVLYDSNKSEVPGTIEINGLTTTFKPSSNLNSDTRYQATIITGATNDVENPMRFEKTWSFLTEGSSSQIH